MSMEHVICNKEADIATIKSDVSHIKSTMDRLDHAILGNGQPGLMSRAVKMEQVISMLVWATGACVTAVLGLAVNLAMSYFKRGGI